MKQSPIYVAFPDIDFMVHIQSAVMTLVKDEDFLIADQHNQKEAIVILATAFGKANYLVRWNKESRDHSNYIRSKLYVGCTPHPLDWDVQYCYDPASKDVYSGDLQLTTVRIP
jgi:hypothetical protein